MVVELKGKPNGFQTHQMIRGRAPSRPAMQPSASLLAERSCTCQGGHGVDFEVVGRLLADMNKQRWQQEASICAWDAL